MTPRAVGDRSGRPVDPAVDPVSRVLSAGTAAVVALVGLGTALVLLQGHRPLESAGPPLDPARLLPDLLAVRPEGFLWLGLVLILALPAARTAVACWSFVRERDRRAALVAGAVLGVLGLSVLVALLSR
jgi:uncharacterized membrane protein